LSKVIVRQSLFLYNLLFETRVVEFSLRNTLLSLLVIIIIIIILKSNSRCVKCCELDL